MCLQLHRTRIHIFTWMNNPEITLPTKSFLFLSNLLKTCTSTFDWFIVSARFLCWSHLVYGFLLPPDT